MGFLWFIFCVGIAMFAKSKGRSPVGWGLAALVISPLIAGVILALLKDLTVTEDIQQVRMDQQQTRDRLAYNEKLTDYRINKVENDINRLESGSSNVQRLDSGQTPLIEARTKECPSCGGFIKSEAIKCKHCGVMVNDLGMKECPYCKENIKVAAIRCKHCKSDLAPEEKVGADDEY